MGCRTIYAVQDPCDYYPEWDLDGLFASPGNDPIRPKLPPWRNDECLSEGSIGPCGCQRWGIVGHRISVQVLTIAAFCLPPQPSDVGSINARVAGNPLDLAARDVN